LDFFSSPKICGKDVGNDGAACMDILSVC
jgi:hypothetical protein